jgi:sporadic carbohydrate cluster 2OG-Fe(II) oxygenase
LEEKSELEKFKKFGFLALDLPEVNLLKTVRDEIVRGINKILNIKIANIEEIRSYATSLDMKGIGKIRSLRLPGISEKLLQALGEKRKLVAGDSVYLQRFPHLNVNVSGKKESVTVSHCEIMSGNAPNTIACWVPLHDVVDESGLYFLDQTATMKLINQTKGFKSTFPSDAKISEWVPKCINLKFGQVVFFNSFVWHGAKQHNHSKARLSVDFRFQDTRHPLFEKNLEYFKYFNCKTSKGTE